MCGLLHFREFVLDRATVYSQEQGRSTDFLFAQRSTMIGLGKVAQAAFGSSTVVRGLAVTPNSPAALNVLVGIGEIYTMAQVDATPWGALPADTTDVIIQQGLNMASQTLATPAPATSGFSVAYLIEAQFQVVDSNSVVLPFFNSANPQIPLNGQGGSGAPLATQRQGVCVIQVKAGIAATTGTQTTPSVDAGWTPLAVVTVANGQSTVTSGNISVAPGSPQVTSLLQMLQTGSAVYAADTSGAANTITLALTPPITSYTDGQPIRFKAANTNTGAVTLNAGGGAISLTGMNGALQGGEIIALKQYEAIYSAATGTAILLGQTAGALQVPPATQSQHAMQLGQATGRLLNVQVFNGSGTYTPTAGMKTAIVEVQGAGGGSGGAPATSAGQFSGSSGASSGTYAKCLLTAAQIGASQTVTIGAAGTAGAAGFSSGGTGGTSSLGSLIACTGGPGSQSYGPSGATLVISNAPTVSATVPTTTGTVIQVTQGSFGNAAIGATSGGVLSGPGGSSPMTGANTGVGAGAPGSVLNASSAATAGAAGGAGKIVIWEFA
jgi:hypothetical protein